MENKNIQKMNLQNDERDIYYCQLPFVKMLTNMWAEAHPNRKQEKIIVILSIIVGFALILGTFYFITINKGARQWQLHISIWIAALIIYLAAKHRNNESIPPFQGIVNVRYEMSDKGIYYIFQKKLTVYTFFIADNDIKEIIYDEKFQILYLKGDGIMTLQSRSGISKPEPKNEQYCLMPYDKFDIDDILEPYGDMVKRVNGDLRLKFAKNC